MPRVLDPFRFVLIAVTGWMDQRQLQIIGYLHEENRVLREQLGGQRVRLDKETLLLSVEPVQVSQVDVITPAASMPGATLSGLSTLKTSWNQFGAVTPQVWKFNFPKFAAPTIAGGKVFLGTFDGTADYENHPGYLLVFGLS